MPPVTTTTLPVVAFNRTVIDHGVPMAMAVIAVVLALLVGLLAGYLLNRD